MSAAIGGGSARCLIVNSLGALTVCRLMSDDADALGVEKPRWKMEFCHAARSVCCSMMPAGRVRRRRDDLQRAGRSARLGAVSCFYCCLSVEQSRVTSETRGFCNQSVASIAIVSVRVDQPSHLHLSIISIIIANSSFRALTTLSNVQMNSLPALKVYKHVTLAKILLPSFLF